MLNYCECVICRGPLTGVSSCKYHVTHTEYHCSIPDHSLWCGRSTLSSDSMIQPRPISLWFWGLEAPHTVTHSSALCSDLTLQADQKWTVYFPQLWSVIRGWHRVNWHWPLESIKGHRNRAISTYYILLVPSRGNQLKVTQILMYSNYTDRRNDEHEVTSSCIHFLFFPPILIEPIDLTRMSIIWQNRKVKK